VTVLYYACVQGNGDEITMCFDLLPVNMAMFNLHLDSYLIKYVMASRVKRVRTRLFNFKLW
jgi:hypothetical protein